MGISLSKNKPISMEKTNKLKETNKKRREELFTEARCYSVEADVDFTVRLHKEKCGCSNCRWGATEDNPIDFETLRYRKKNALLKRRF